MPSPTVEFSFDYNCYFVCVAGYRIADFKSAAAAESYITFLARINEGVPSVYVQDMPRLWSEGLGKADGYSVP